MSRKAPELAWREGRRRRAWELQQQGWKQQDIAAALGVTPGTVGQWLKRAREQGVDALLGIRGRGECFLGRELAVDVGQRHRALSRAQVHADTDALDFYRALGGAASPVTLYTFASGET